jgi:hypothetical protein
MRTVGFSAVALTILAFVAVLWLGETVILRTVDSSGGEETRLWVVDREGASWLRSASDHGWFQRLQANPDVELKRRGRWSRFRAVASESEAERAIVNRLMAEKYGIADSIIGGVFDHSMPVVVRLEPR